VLEANMAKEVGRKESRPNPLGLPDLIKPEGWTAPSHEGNHGIISSSFDSAILDAKMKCKIEGLDLGTTEIKSNWSSDERMDIIGQNGNDGDHYEKLEHPTEYQDGTKIDFGQDSEFLRVSGINHNDDRNEETDADQTEYVGYEDAIKSSNAYKEAQNMKEKYGRAVETMPELIIGTPPNTLTTKKEDE
jgi:hypothetical protein